MKTLKLTITITAIMMLFASSAMAMIQGSLHDFGNVTGNGLGVNAATGQFEICIACHTPHNAMDPALGDPVDKAPLWNHDITPQPGLGGYTIYTGPSGTMQAVTGQPTGVSLLCLSCHDGTINIDAFGGGANATPIGAVPGNFGTGLDNDHPISFVWTDAISGLDGELYLPETDLGPGGVLTIEEEMLFGVNGARSLECASCHDVHDTASTGNFYMLLVDNADSALCLTCHNK